MKICLLRQIYLDGALIQNHLVFNAIKQWKQQLTFLVPVRFPFSMEGLLTFMIHSALQVFLTALESFLSSYKASESIQCHTNFASAGTKIKKSMKKHHTGLLHIAPDWRVMSDLIDKLVIPSWIVISQLRPDIFSFPKTQKTCIIIELSHVPVMITLSLGTRKKFKYTNHQVPQ